MFEVEKKYVVTEKQKKRLIKGAEFLGEKIIVDEYFDTEDYNLTLNDMWLRCRNGTFEINLPMDKNGKGFANRYQEVEGEDKIRQIFAINPEKSFREDIRSFGYETFLRCSTERREYKKGKFKIIFDEADFGDFKFSISEIELMVENAGEIQKASEEIFEFSRKQGLVNKNNQGKIIEYLRAKKPKHFKALVERGVVVE